MGRFWAYKEFFSFQGDNFSQNMFPGPVLPKIKIRITSVIYEMSLFFLGNLPTHKIEIWIESFWEIMARSYLLGLFYFSVRHEPVCKEQVRHMCYKPWKLQWSLGKFTGMLKCSYIVSLFLHPTLLQNVVICYFDKKTFFIKHPLLTPTFLGLFQQILLPIGFSPFLFVLYFSKSKISVGSIFLEQVTVLSSVIILMIIV